MKFEDDGHILFNGKPVPRKEEAGSSLQNMERTWNDIYVRYCNVPDSDPVIDLATETIVHAEGGKWVEIPDEQLLAVSEKLPGMFWEHPDLLTAEDEEEERMEARLEKRRRQIEKVRARKKVKIEESDEESETEDEDEEMEETEEEDDEESGTESEGDEEDDEEESGSEYEQ